MKRTSLFIAMVSLILIAVFAMAQTPQRRPGPAPRPATTNAAPQTRAAADLTIRQRMSFAGTGGEDAGQNMGVETTTMIKGARERTESSTKINGMTMGGQANILQCDLKRNIAINDRAHKYMITPISQSSDAGSSEDSSAPASSGPSRRGGVVTETITATDTGERKQIFGFTARHLKTSMTLEPSPTACEQTKMKMETDGWYIDFEYGLTCETAQQMTMGRGARGGCQDEYRIRNVGTVRPGFPIEVTTKIYGPDGTTVVSTHKTEVLEISRNPLDPALFDVPAGYTETHDTSELYAADTSAMMAEAMKNARQQSGANENQASEAAAMAAASGQKRPGTIRIGVTMINNRSDRTSVSTEALRSRLIGELTDSNIDAVPLGQSADLEAEAKQLGCDFILYTDITQIKPASSGKKIGGFLGRAAGVDTGAEKTDSRVEFRLMPIGGAGAQLQSNSTGKESSDEESVGAAIDKEAQMVKSAARKRG